MSRRSDIADLFSVPGAGAPFFSAEAPTETGGAHPGTIPPASSDADASRKLPPDIFAGEPTMRELEERYFRLMFRMKNGRVDGEDGLAKTLGLSRSGVYTWIKRLGLKI